MNYLYHYNKLINRARIRVVDTYTEIHHIIPKCMNGTNDKSNLVRLTPEEHYVAHQLLVKIYPDNMKLILAASIMCLTRSNKKYDWLKRKQSVAMSALQAGELNSQHGTVWMHNTELKISKKIRIHEKDNAISSGWKIGRRLNFNDQNSLCCVCNQSFIGSRKTCSRTCRNKNISNQRKLSNPLRGREQEFLELYSKYESMNAALKTMGFPGATSCYYDAAKIILENIGDWCNGSIVASEAEADGSIPSSPASLLL